MAAMTSTLRFPGYFYNDLSSIVSALAPVQYCHFVIAGYTPFSADTVDNVPLPCLCRILGQVDPEDKRFRCCEETLAAEKPHGLDISEQEEQLCVHLGADPRRG